MEKKRTGLAVSIAGGFIIVLCTVFLVTGCGPDPILPGTLTLNFTGMEEFNGKSLYYDISTFLPAERAMDDARRFTGFEVITGGEVHMTVEDPDVPGTDYVFKANNVMSIHVYIDADGNGENNGLIDYELDNVFEVQGSAHINGDMVINAAYPGNFHPSESGNANVTLLKSNGLMISRDAVTDMGNVTVNTPADITLYIENNGGALLVLEGTPLVSLSGVTSAPFSVTAQPVSATVDPGDMIAFTIQVLATSAGTYSAVITIPFNDFNIDDPEEESPYVTTISVTAN